MNENTEKINYTNYTVLFLDNNRKVLNSLKHATENELYNKIFTSSINEFLSIIKKEKIAVVVSEMRLADSSGLEVLEQVKKISPETVRNILSSYTQRTTLLTTINSGLVYKYISKPWDTENELLPAIKSAIIHHRKKMKKMKNEK